VRPLSLITILAALVTTSAAQELLWQQVGVPGQMHIGGATVFIGDVDGDGYDDLVNHAVNTALGRNELHVRSGRDGSLLRVDVPTLGIGQAVRTLMPAGDMDRDGIRDYAFSTLETRFNPFVSTVEARSATTGALLWQVIAPFTDLLGEALAADLDLDGDGRPDLVASAPGENGNFGAIHAYDNLGRPLYTLLDTCQTLAPLGGDLDGDSIDDYVSGKGFAEGARGGVFVRSGRTGLVVRAGIGERAGDQVGSGTVAGCGDVDADGSLDFLGSSHGGSPTPGVVRVFSGASGNAIHTWRRPSGSLYGSQIAAGDLDLDGIADLLIGPITCSTMPATSALEWRSLRTGEAMHELCAPDPIPANFGWLPSAIGRPQPGSPFPVIAVSEPLYNYPTPLQGRLLFYRATPPNVVALGSGCSGRLDSAPRLGFVDRGAAGALVHLSHAPPSASALLLLGISSTSWLGQPLPLALAALGLPACALHTSIEAAVPVTAGSTGNAKGYARFPIPLPLSSGLGATVCAQWLVLDARAGAAALSAGICWQH
jgi:hypothetical protein